jgi:hypothetical protein
MYWCLFLLHIYLSDALHRRVAPVYNLSLLNEFYPRIISGTDNRRKIMRKIIIIGITLVMLMALVLPCYASNEGNPDCEILGYQYGTKYDCPANGCVGTVVLPTDNPAGPSGTFTMVFSDPQLDWTSTIGVDAVIVKGASVYPNIFTYNPESFGADGLITPLVTNPGQPNGFHPAISHVEFCYDDDDNQVPEFPTLALPVAMIIGFLGLVHVVRSTKEN